MHGKRPSNLTGLCFYIVIGIGIFFRLMYPGADPPAGLSWSGGYMADEGFWAQDARSRVIFGHYGPDEWHNRWVSPLIHLITLILFKLLSPSMIALRIWAAFCSLATLWIMIQISRYSGLSDWVGLLAGSCSLFIAYQKIAILETPLSLLGALTFLIWLVSTRSEKTGYDYLAGLTLGAMYITKNNQIYLLVACLTATAWQSGWSKKAAKRTTMQVLGFMSVVGPWFATVLIPNIDLILKYQAYYASQQGQGWSAILKNLAVQPFFVYFNRCPWVFLIMWMLVFRLFAAKQCRASLIPGMKFSLAWFISGIFFLAPMGYRPLRYYVPLLIPMFFAGGWWLDSIGQVFQHRKPAFYRLLFPVWMMIPISMNLIVIGDLFFFDGRWLKVGQLPGFSIAGAFLTILTGVFILYAEYRPKRRILTGWVVLLIFVDFFRLGDWMIHRTYYIRDASRDLAAILPESSVIAGQWAPQLVLETRHVAIPMWKDFVNDKDPLHTYHVTHVLSWQYAYGDELELQKRNFPELMDNADLIKSYQIKNSPVLLWEIRKKSAGSDPAL